MGNSMSRLIVFGDSFTYGQALPDCNVTSYPNGCGPTPSRLAWPQLLGDMLGLEVVNVSTPGWSNIQILRDVINFEILPTDTIIIGWTYSLRDCIFKINTSGVLEEFRLSVWDKDTKFIEKYFEVHNDHDLAVRAGLYMHHAESFLKTLGVKRYHFCVYNGWDEVMFSFTKVPENFIQTEILSHNLDTALDNSHPGTLSHRQAAERLYKVINATK